MANDYFQFKEFTIYHDKCAFKVGTDGVLLGAAADISGAKNILDIGTGTGLIALMLAQRSNAEITAIEPDSISFMQASENISLSKWNNRIKLVPTTFQDFEDVKRFDLIVTNPPFFVDSLKNPDSRKSATRHNDSLTSDDIIRGALKFLSEEGKLQLILPFAEGNIFIDKAHDLGLYLYIKLNIRSLPGSLIKRMILGFSRNKAGLTKRELVIEKGSRHEYSEEYINLTKDFYLNF